MSDAERAPRRSTRLLYAAGGAVIGAGAALGGAFAWQRRQRAEPPLDDISGRGIAETPPSPQAQRQGFEIEDMSAGAMALLTVGLGATIGVVIWLMVMMLHGFQASRDADPPFTAQQQAAQLPPLPRLQSGPLDDMANLRRSENQRLDHYGWVDPQHLRARIPIGIAMGRTVGHSLDEMPDAPALDVPASGGTP